jgi:putative tricarboxylic transport membrane protein
MLIGMGFLGYFLRKLNFNPAPVILGLVLGPMLENSLRESLYLNRGNFWAIISRPIPALLFTVAIAIILIPFLARLLKSFGKQPRMN